MTISTSNIAEDLPALPLPKVFLLYGKAKLLFQPEERLFQWRFGKQQRVQCIESTDDANNAQKKAKEALQALKYSFFKPVIIFDKGESSNALEIFDYNLPDFAIIEAADDPEEVEYLLCNPEASVEAIWYPLLEGEAIAEPPAIWRDPKFLGNYGKAFVQWLRRHPERHGMEPLVDLKLDDFNIDIPQPEGHYRLAHQFFPLAWLDIERGGDAWQATPGGALDGIDADELYILHDKKDMALAEVSEKAWKMRLDIPDPVNLPKTGVFIKFIDIVKNVVNDDVYGLLQLPAAASSTENSPISLIRSDKNYECTITNELIPGNDRYQFLCCRFNDDGTNNFEGTIAYCKIGDKTYKLGKIVNGSVKGFIPIDINLKHTYPSVYLD